MNYQHPPPCPANYIARLDLKQISEAILESVECVENSTLCIGTTVTIRGIGGIGKSTLAKALCHDPVIKNYFTDGFLWISLTPPLSSPLTKLSEIYQKLTDKLSQCNFGLLKDKIRSTVSNKLLVILDNVWEVEDVKDYVEVFSSCKTILTTRNKEINVEIPAKYVFDINSMTNDEAIQLLTWKIPKLKTLHPRDVKSIQKLANDLHFWPLLLNLVRGQLYIHCSEWNESPKNAILSVHRKLSSHGLTAFDPKHANIENAVWASIIASLELLSDNDKHLLYHIISSLGIGSCVLRKTALRFSEMDTEQFNKSIKTLWSYGLVNFETIKFSTKRLSCLEVHEVIAQYITDEMPYSYYKFLSELTIDFYKCRKIYKQLTRAGLKLLGTDFGIFMWHIDILMFPYFIRFFTVNAIVKKVEFLEALDNLIESHENIVETTALQRYLKTASTKKVYMTLKHDCKALQLLLNDNKHDEAKVWLKDYCKNQINATEVVQLHDELLFECKDNPAVVASINETIGSVYYRGPVQQPVPSVLIDFRKAVLQIVGSMADKDKVYEILETMMFTLTDIVKQIKVKI